MVDQEIKWQCLRRKEKPSILQRLGVGKSSMSYTKVDVHSCFWGEIQHLVQIIVFCYTKHKEYGKGIG
jgi:hypothetical protein